MLFHDGHIQKDVFLTHIHDNGADWDDIITDQTTGFQTYIYYAVNKVTKVRITLHKDEEWIPKNTAINWLFQLGIKTKAYHK